MDNQNLISVDAYWWAVGITVASIIIGLLLHTKILWNYRIVMAALLACMIGVSTGLLVVSTIPLVATMIFIIQGYRLFSSLRIVANRIEFKMLRGRSLRTEAYLSTILLFILAVEHVGFTLYLEDLLVVLACLQLIIAGVFFRHVTTMQKQTTIRLPKKFTADIDLPTVTIAIPARNETADLTDCIRSILRTNYPKLEVLVLDDCSQDKTSDIIRKFAHNGVRFLKGTQPSSAWIAKNHAYDQLLDEASGEYVLFCGTDVRFEPNSLRLLVEVMLKDHKNMITVLPVRSQVSDHNFLLQPMRYWRELAVPRLFARTPPALSTCWIAKRSMLKKYGGFGALRKTIRPESYIARGVNKEGHYLFLCASSGIGISSIKVLRQQWATATRTRYPELHNRPESVLFSSLLQLIILVGPIVVIVVSIIIGMGAPVFIASLALAYLLAVHMKVATMTSGVRQTHPLLLYPVSVLLEIFVTNYSMWAYEFSDVIWKGRNVCLPVLKTNLRLPKLDN